MTFSRRAAAEMTKRVERIARKVMGDNAGVMTYALTSGTEPTTASAPGCCASMPNRSAWTPPSRPIDQVGADLALFEIPRLALRRRLLRRQSVPRAEPSLFLCLQLRFVFRDKRANFGRHIEQL